MDELCASVDHDQPDTLDSPLATKERAASCRYSNAS